MNQKTEPKFLQDNLEKWHRRWKNDLQCENIFGTVIPGENGIILQSNDYLSIAQHPEIVEAKVNDLKSNPNNSPSVFDQSTMSIQQEFEIAMAKQMNTEESVLFPSGYAANVGIIQAIANNSARYPYLDWDGAGSEIPIYIDELAHMSLHEGISSAGAKKVPFGHNNTTELEEKIKKHGSGVIAVDTINNANGSLTKLEAVVEIGNVYNCVLVVDESHSLGLFGETGGTLVEHLGLTDR